MNLLPNTRRARMRRNCGGFLFDSNKSTSSTNTTVSVDSFNRSFNSVKNQSNSGNLNIAVNQPGADIFGAPGDAVKKLALYVVASLGLVAALAWTLGQKK